MAPDFACHKTLLSAIKDYLVKVEILCSEIGLPYLEYEKRSDVHIRKILRKTLDFEKEMMNYKIQLTCDIDKDTLQVNLLCEQLRLDAGVFLPSKLLSCYDKQEFLQQQIALLSEKKRDAEIKEFKEQQNMLRALVDTVKKPNLDDGERYLAEVEPEKLSDFPMDLILVSIKKLEELKDSNRKKSIQLISSIKSVLQVLKIPNSTEHLLNSSLDDQVLYQVDTVTELEKKLDFYIDLKRSKIKSCLENVRTEIKTLWDECHFSEEYKLSCKTFFEGSTNSEEDLSQLESYLSNLKDIASQLAAIDAKIAVQKSQLQELEEVEVRLNDPDKFLNRGGRLLKDETLKKKLFHSLPKIEAEIISEIELLKESVDLSLRGDLESFSEECAERWKSLHDKKNHEIQVRHKNKIESLNHDLRYGSKPAAVSKKHVAGLAVKTTEEVKKKITKIPVHAEKPTMFVMDRPIPEESVLCYRSKLKNSRDPATSTPNNPPTKRFKPSED